MKFEPSKLSKTVKPETETDTQKPKRTCILVLGMHRSGTSAITRVLSYMGATLPQNILGANEGNEAGYWEPERLVLVHDELLAELGSSWDDWQKLKLSHLSPERSRYFKLKIKEILKEEYRDSDLFVLKDPRICRFLPLYTDLLKELDVDLKIVVQFRNPISVMESLRVRNDMPRSDAALLWLQHVITSEAESRGFERVIIKYDEIIKHWRKGYNAITSQFTIEWPYQLEEIEDQIDEFISANLRHHEFKDDEALLDPMLRQWIGEAHNALLVLQNIPSSESAQKRLDKIRAEFEAASPMLAQIKSSIRENLEQLLSERNEQLAIKDDVIAEREQQLSLKDEEITKIEQQVSLKDDQLAEDEQLLTEKDSFISELERQVSRKDEVIAESEQQIVQRDETIAECEKQIAQKDEIIAEQALRIVSKDTVIEEQKQHLNEFSRKVNWNKFVVKELYNSTSWKITGPLRNLKTIIASIKKRLSTFFKIFPLVLPAIRVGGGIWKTILLTKSTYKKEGFQGIIQKLGYIDNKLPSDSSLIKRSKIPNKRKHNSYDRLRTSSISRVNRLSIFASYNKDGKILPYVEYYLKHLSYISDKIIFVSDNKICTTEMNKIKPYIFDNISDKHGEYDFGSYKRGLVYARKNNLLIDNIEELILCNDSCYGPVWSFKNMFEEMSQYDCDFWGVTSTYNIKYHLQSYFMVFKKNIIDSYKLDEFLSRVKAEPSVREVILNYEVPLTEALELKGFKSASFINPETPSYKQNEKKIYYLEHFPLKLLEKKSPLIKAKSLLNAKHNLNGVDITLQHLESVNRDLFVSANEISRINVHQNAPNVSFSFVMPTYNRKNLISNAIESLLNQKGDNLFELIIVDDGSNDQTEELIRKKYDELLVDGKIVYIRIDENVGVCRARNVGLKAAKYPWIAYLDSDNTLRPYFLTLFSNTIVENNSSKVFYAQICNDIGGHVIGQEFDKEKIYQGNYIDLGVLVHQRSCFIELGGFDENLSRLVDWDLILRYTKIYPPVYIPHVVIDYNNKPIENRISLKECAVKNKIKIIKKHTTLPTVSTAILTYNHEKYIEKAIDSAIRQKGINHEILISDDFSSDNTRKIISNYQKKHPLTIRNISTKENLGISNNFQNCFKHANGDFIAILEGDDYWQDDFKLRKQAMFLEENSDCSMVFSKIKILKQSTGEYINLERQDNIKKTKLDGFDFLNDPNMNLIANFSSCMFHTHLMKAAPSNLFDERMNEICVAFYLEKIGKIGFLNEIMSVYRQHSGGVWTGSDLKEQREAGRKIREIAKRIADHKYKKKIQEIIDSKYSD